MTKKVTEVLENRGRLIEQMQALSAAHPDGFDSDTQVKYDAINADQEKCKATADRLHNESRLAAELSAPIDNAARPQIGDAPAGKAVNRDEYKAALDTYIRTGRISNALEVGTNSEGGHLTSDSFDASFREIRDDYNALRPLCNVITTTGSHKIRVESSIGAASWLAEEGAYAEADPAFTSVTLDAYKLTKLVKVTEELLQDSDFNVEAYLAREFGRAFGIAEEAAFVAGAGTTQPTGILSGASTVTPTSSPLPTTITAQAVLDVFYAVGRQYRSMATWLVNDTEVAVIRSITDANDNFIWQPGLQAGQPDRILGRPFISTSSLGTSGNSPEEAVLFFGDLKDYTIADRTGFSIQRLNELYAGNGFVGFRGWARSDGKTVQAASFKKLVL